MKTVLCYGDSNTWGQVAFEERQIETAKQWPVLLGVLLGADYKVLQEGLCARIAGNYETKKPELNGKDSFERIYKNAGPVNLLIIALGTNDLKKRYQRTAEDIAHDLLWYKEKVVELADESNPPCVVYVAPPNFSAPKEYFDADEDVRLELIEILNKEADVVAFSHLELSEDGVHISLEDHRKIADELTKVIEEKL